MSARMRALLVLIAVFLVGGSAGFVLREFTKTKAQAQNENRPPSRDRRGPRLEQLLQLTPEQNARFKEIMSELRVQFDKVQDEHQSRIDEIDKVFRPQFLAVRTEMNRRIVEILNDEQKEKFLQIQKDREQREKEREMNSKKGRRKPDRPGSPPDPHR